MHVIQKAAVYSFILIIACNSTKASYSDIGANEKPTRTHSELGKLTKEEKKIIKKTIAGMSAEHFHAFHQAIIQQNETLLANYTKSIISRHAKLIKWGKFHDGFSGKAKAVGFVIAGLAALSLTVSQVIPVTCGEPNWWGIASIIIGGVGGFSVWLSEKSQESRQKIDDLIMSEIGRNQHTLSLLDEALKNMDYNPELVGEDGQGIERLRMIIKGKQEDTGN